MGYLPLINR